MHDYELNYCDTCLLDFFSGSHLPVIQIAVDKNTTYLSLRTELFSSEAIDHLYYQYPDLDFAIYQKAVTAIFEEVAKRGNLDRQFADSSDVEVNKEEFTDSVYAFFTLVLPEQSI